VFVENTTVDHGWAVVGLGVHAVERMLPAIRRSSHARLVGICSRRRSVANDIAGRYGVRAYETLDAVLADPDVRIVYLATPNDAHAEQTLRCAAAGKHVLVEKPMALSPEEAAAMVRAASAAGVGLYVGFQLRFHPAHLRARDIVRTGEIGDVVWAGARWASYRERDTGWRLDLKRSGGTLLTARGVHLIDLVRFVCASEFECVSGMSDGLRADQPADDLTQGIGRLASGTFVSMLCSRLATGASNDLEIFGTGGTLVCRSTIGAEPTGSLTIIRGPDREVHSYEDCDVLADEVDWVASAVAGVRTDRIGATGEDGARVAAVTAALMASVCEARTITLGEDV